MNEWQQAEQVVQAGVDPGSAHTLPPGAGDGGDGEGDGGDGGDGPDGYVDPIGPNLMSPYFTVASGLFAIKSAGTPELSAQVPRFEPGWPAGASTGKCASSQSM